MRRLIDWFRQGLTGAARWVVISTVGIALVVAGIVMIFTPGPGLAALALGLWLLSKQFRWAQRILERLTATLEARRDRLPAFVGRILDERARRRAIAEMADGHANADDAARVEVDLDAPDAEGEALPPDGASGTTGPDRVVTPDREPGGAA